MKLFRVFYSGHMMGGSKFKASRLILAKSAKAAKKWKQKKFDDIEMKVKVTKVTKYKGRVPIQEIEAA